VLHTPSLRFVFTIVLGLGFASFLVSCDDSSSSTTKKAGISSAELEEGLETAESVKKEAEEKKEEKKEESEKKVEKRDTRRGRSR
jgi:hypothetical protein